MKRELTVPLPQVRLQKVNKSGSAQLSLLRCDIIMIILLHECCNLFLNTYNEAYSIYSFEKVVDINNATSIERERRKLI